MDSFKGLIFVFLALALRVSTEDVTDIDLIDTSSETPLELKLPTGVPETAFTSCSLTWPNGSTTEKPDETDMGLIQYQKPCNFKPKKFWTMLLSGVYKLVLSYKTADEDKSISKQYNLNWLREATPSASQIFSKQILTIRMLPPEDLVLKSCEYSKLQENEESALQSGIVNGQCQVTLKDITTNYDGLWQVLATTESLQRLKAIVEVSVIDEKELESSKEASVILSPNNNVINANVGIVKVLHCSLYDNFQKLVYEVFGPCNYKINVQKHNEGKWKALFNLAGRIEIFEQIINVKVLEEQKFEASCKNVDKTKDINMSCKCPSAEEKTCLFTGPSRQVIGSTEGVGNIKYSFFSNFDKSSGRQECGLTIKSQDKADAGTWKCRVQDSCSLHIQITEDKGCAATDENTELIPRSPETFFALNGTSTVGPTCSIDANLQYCFFQTNLGDEVAGVFSIQEQGLCIMPKYNYLTNHTGKWQCTLGVTNQQKEYSKDIDVQVLLSWFQPTQREFVYKKDTGVELKCMNHIPFNNEVSLCRFVRPDGHIIKLDVGDEHEHYKSTSEPSNGICSLKLSEMKAEDKGNWKCSSITVMDNTWLAEEFLVSSGTLFKMSIALVALVSIIATTCHL